MRKRPLFWFYLLAFAISWAGWLPMVAASRGVSWFQHPAFQILLLLPAAGPALAAIIVQRAVVGKKETGRWFRSLWRWRVEWRWLGTAIILPAVLLLASQATAQVLGLPSAWESPDENKASLVVFMFVTALLSNPWEEVGWRGFATPRLQKRHTALTTSLIVGVLWALWHLPLFFWTDNPMSDYPFTVWFISTVGEAFIYTWLYNSTRGNVLIVALYHVLCNTYGVLIGSGSVIASCIVNIVVAGALVGVLGKTNLARSKRVTA